jgi:hypothetical protein
MPHGSARSFSPLIKRPLFWLPGCNGNDLVGEFHPAFPILTSVNYGDTSVKHKFKGANLKGNTSKKLFAFPLSLWYHVSVHKEKNAKISQEENIWQ